MKFNFIQTLGKYKSFELSSNETACGKFKAQLSTSEDGKSRMILTQGNTTGDIKIGEWTFSKVIDIVPRNNSILYLVEGIMPDGKEFSYRRSFSLDSMRYTDIPVNFILLTAALNDLDKASVILESMSKNTPYYIDNVKAELEKLYPVIDDINAVVVNYYFDQTFKDWMLRTLTTRIALLEKILEFKEQNS